MSIDLVARALAQKALTEDSGSGASAYEIAVANGFVGSEADWLASLKGEDGESSAGASAYDIAVANGFVGDQSAWLASLKGQDGAGGDPDALAALQAQLEAALGRIVVLESPDVLRPLELTPSTVAEHAAPGTPIGDLIGIHPFEVITLVSNAGGRLILDSGRVRAGLVGFDYAAAQEHVLEVQRQLAKPGNPVVEDLVELTVHVLPELRPLALPDREFAVDLAQSAELLDLGLPLPGETRAVAPNDGRVVVNEAGDKLLRGPAAWATGAATYTIVQSHPAATNSPRESEWSIIISPAKTSGELVAQPVIGGIFTQGRIATVTDAVWDQLASSIDTRWYVGDDDSSSGAVLAGESGQALDFGAELVGRFVRVGQVGHLPGGPSAEAFSQWVGPIAAQLTIAGAPSTEVAFGDSYTFIPTIAGGHAPYAVTNEGPALPAGWLLDPETGALTSDDVQAELAGVMLKVTDADGLTATLPAFDVGRLLPPKRYNFSLRQTAAGSNTWNAGGINLGTDVDRNDDETVTSIILATGNAYPEVTADGQLSYYRSRGSAPGGSNWSAAQSGMNPLLGGSLTLSTKPAYTFEVPGPGDYDVWFAAGAGSTSSTEEVVLFEGLDSQLSAIITSTPKVWKAATAFALNTVMVSPADRSVWKAANAGNSGAAPPSGAGPTSVDGTITWNRLAIDALEIFAGVTGTTSYVIDQNNVSVPPSAWDAQPPRDFRVTGVWGEGFTWFSDATSRVRQFSFRAKGAVLEDVSLFDNQGNSDGLAPTLYANQPEGHLAYRIVPTGGRNSLSAYTLGGELAEYFTLSSYGGSVWLTANGNRLPDALAGERSLTITQTDGNSSGSPHTTTLNAMVVSSQGRPTNDAYLGKVSTEYWLRRREITSVADTAWEGYAGQPFASDVLVNNPAQLNAALNALTPDGVSWYRIRIGAGVYEGNRYEAIAKVFGDGGLLIEPAAGQDPEFDYGFQNLQVHGLHIRGLKMPANKLKTGLAFFLRSNDPGPGGIAGSGKFTRLMLEDCRFGINFGAGNNSETDWQAKHSYPLYVDHGESLRVRNCRVDGASAVYLANGVRKQVYEGGIQDRCTGDIFGIGQSQGWNSTLDVFEDNDVYVVVRDMAIQRELDYAGYANGAHQDWFQVRTWANNMTNWFPNAKPDNLSVTDERFPFWKVGDRCLNTETEVAAVYEVVAVSKADALTGGGVGPSGHGQAIVDGDVTWKWVVDYIWDNDMHVLMENNSVNAAVPVSGVGGRQFFINSNGNHRSMANLVAGNNAYGSFSSYGIGQADGDVFAEHNTFAGPSVLKSTTVVNPASIRINGTGHLHSMHNIVQSPSYVLGSATKHVYGELVLNWGSAAASPNRPIDRLNGPLEQDGTGRWTYPSLALDGSYTAAALAAALRGILAAKPGVAAGIKAVE